MLKYSLHIRYRRAVYEDTVSVYTTHKVSHTNSTRAGGSSHLELAKVLSSYGDSEDLFNHLRDKRSVKGKTDDFFHLLLLQLIVDCIAVDTSECERAFALMNRLQGFTRNRMGHFTLHLLMTLCSLGKSCE